MAWTLPVTIALISLSALLMFLSRVFDKEQRWIKTLLIMFSLGTCILVSQILRIIIDSNATGDVLTKLQTMTDVSLIISIVLFSFFLMYFLISYTIYVIKGLKESKKRRRFGDEE